MRTIDYSLLLDYGTIEIKSYLWDVVEPLTDQEVYERGMQQLKESGVKLPNEQAIITVGVERCS